MKPIRKEIKEQIARMSALPFRPEAEGLNELARVLQETTRDLDHARRTIDAWMEYSTEGGSQRWPTPQDLRSTAYSLLTEAQRSIGCKYCNGLGFIVAKAKTKAGVEYEGSAPCPKCHPLSKSKPAPAKLELPKVKTL